MTVSERQEKRRMEIAAVVREFMKDHDFDSITVDDICNATGIAKGTFYHYFEGKGSLLSQVLYPIDDYFASLEDELLKCDSFVGAICEYVGFYATYIAESGLKMSRTVILSMISNKNTLYISKRRGLVRTLLDIIQYWKEKGEVPAELSSERICHMFIVLIRGYLLDWYSCGGSYDIEEELVEHARLFALSIVHK